MNFFQIITSFASRCPKWHMHVHLYLALWNFISQHSSKTNGALQFRIQKTNVTTNLRRFASPFNQGNSFTLNQGSAISLNINTVLNVWELLHSSLQFVGNNICSRFTEHAHFSLCRWSFGRIGQTAQPPFVKLLHEIADFFIAPILKGNQLRFHQIPLASLLTFSSLLRKFSRFVFFCKKYKRQTVSDQ